MADFYNYTEGFKVVESESNKVASVLYLENANVNLPIQNNVSTVDIFQDDDDPAKSFRSVAGQFFVREAGLYQIHVSLIFKGAEPGYAKLSLRFDGDPFKDVDFQTVTIRDSTTEGTICGGVVSFYLLPTDAINLSLFYKGDANNNQELEAVDVGKIAVSKIIYTQLS